MNGIVLAVVTIVLIAATIMLLAVTDYGDAAEVCFPHRVIWVGEERAYCGVVGWRDLP